MFKKCYLNNSDTTWDNSGATRAATSDYFHYWLNLLFLFLLIIVESSKNMNHMFRKTQSDVFKTQAK